MIDIITAIISAVAMIAVAFLGYQANKNKKEQEERDKRYEEREKIREQDSLLQMKMMHATLQLSVVSANALTGGKNNGNVEEAKKAAENVDKEYLSFLQQVASHQVAQR